MASGHVHVWKKKGTNTEKPGAIVRSWSCFCGAAKVRESKADAIAWAEDLERRGWHGVNVYEVER